MGQLYTATTFGGLTYFSVDDVALGRPTFIHAHANTCTHMQPHSPLMSYLRMKGCSVKEYPPMTQSMSSMSTVVWDDLSSRAEAGSEWVSWLVMS